MNPNKQEEKKAAMKEGSATLLGLLTGQIPWAEAVGPKAPASATAPATAQAPALTPPTIPSFQPIPGPVLGPSAPAQATAPATAPASAIASGLYNIPSGLDALIARLPNQFF